MAEESTNAAKAPTPDGKPTSRAQLNTAVPPVLATAEQGIGARIARLYRRVNEVLAGMYTGVGCSGTPHSHHSYPDQTRPKSGRPGPR